MGGLNNLALGQDSSSLCLWIDRLVFLVFRTFLLKSVFRISYNIFWICLSFSSSKIHPASLPTLKNTQINNNKKPPNTQLHFYCLYVLPGMSTHWSSIGDLPETTPLKKSYSSSPSSYQLPTAPQLEVRGCAHLPSSFWAFVWLEISQPLRTLTNGKKYSLKMFTFIFLHFVGATEERRDKWEKSSRTFIGAVSTVWLRVLIRGVNIGTDICTFINKLSSSLSSIKEQKTTYLKGIL